VSIDGDEIVVAAPNENGIGSYTGALYVFTRPANGWRDTTSAAKLYASDGSAYDRLGWGALSIVQDRIVAGAWSSDDTAGAVYVFDKPWNGWTDTTESAKLTASDGESQDRFGTSVSAQGNRVLVGAPGDYDNGPESGSAYLFIDSIPPVQKTVRTKQSNCSEFRIDIRNRRVTVPSPATEGAYTVAFYSVNGRLIARRALTESGTDISPYLEQLKSSALIIALEHDRRRVFSRMLVLP
jgi:hypothetical protein